MLFFWLDKQIVLVTELAVRVLILPLVKQEQAKTACSGFNFIMVISGLNFDFITKPPSRQEH